MIKSILRSNWFFGIASRVIQALHWLVLSTCRFSAEAPDETLELASDDKPIIIGFTHPYGISSQIFGLKSPLTAKKKFFALLSESTDGRLMARLAKNVNAKPVWIDKGTSEVRSLIQIIKMVKDGYSYTVTPDGSTGPQYVFKSGIWMVAQKTGVPVVLVSFALTPHIKLKTWDRYRLPLPFSHVRAKASAPIWVAPDQKLPKYNKARQPAFGTGDPLLEAEAQYQQDSLAFIEKWEG